MHLMFLKKMGGDIRRAPSDARASSDEGWERTSEDASVMTYSSARAAVEDAGAGARARGMIVTNAMKRGCGRVDFEGLVEGS